MPASDWMFVLGHFTLSCTLQRTSWHRDLAISVCRGVSTPSGYRLLHNPNFILPAAMPASPLSFNLPTEQTRGGGRGRHGNPNPNVMGFGGEAFEGGGN